MSDGSCPNHKRLADYAAGALPEAAAEAVNAHVDSCQTCQAVLQTIHENGETRRPHAAPPPGVGLPDISANQPAVEGHLAEYKLLEKLGRGGMGVVYKALHTELDRVVAVKVLPLGLVDDEQAVARFKREIKAVGRLDHPNIVRAHDARECNGTHFLVMELVTGVDLAELVRRVGPLPIGDACELIRQAALGLECAHQEGLVHRDIKPSNLMLSDAGVVKILDMGLARFRTLQPADGEMTVSGQALGTPDYMAPEQVKDSHGADIRADLYSLGCTLYYLLTGQAPFSGAAYRTAFDKMTAHVHQSVSPVVHFRSEVPDGLAKVLDKTLAKEPDDRHATPAELGEAVAPFAAGSDLRALVASAEGRSLTPRPQADATRQHFDPTPKRRRVRNWLIAAAVGALAIVMVAIAIGYRPWRDDERTPQSVPPGPKTETAAGPDLAGWIVMSWTLRGTGRPDLWLFRPDGSQRVQLTDDPHSFDVHPSFSPDGRRIAFIRGVQSDQQTNVWICGADGKDEREVVSPATDSERFLSPVWLSDSKICYTRDPMLDRRPDMEVWEIDLEEGQPELMFSFFDTPTGGNGVVTDVSPDRRRLAVIAQTSWAWPMSNVYVTDLEGKLVETLWQDDPDDRKDARVLWSDDGTRVAWHHNFTRGGLAETFYYGVGMAQLAPEGTWDCRLQTNRELLVTPLAWSPGGPYLLCAQMSSDESRATLILMDDQFQTARELFELETHGWQPGQRDFGNLADWAIVPDDVPVPVGD